MFCFGILGFIWYFDPLEIFSTADAEKLTVVNVFLTLEVNLLVKIFFLFLTILLDAALPSQYSAGVVNLFLDRQSTTSKVRERKQVWA